MIRPSLSGIDVGRVGVDGAPNSVSYSNRVKGKTTTAAAAAREDALQMPGRRVSPCPTLERRREGATAARAAVLKMFTGKTALPMAE